jgi:hypothetical protein
MGIFDFLAEKARAEQATATPAPVVIPQGTPTPAVSPAEIESDRQARQAAAEFARVDPEAAMAGAVAIPAPPKPKLIPIGTPTPAVSPEEIAADREARRLEAEAAGARIAGEQAAAMEPAAAPIAPEAAISTPVEQVPPIAQNVPAEVTAPAPAAAAVEPTFAEKLNTVAKKRGRGFLDALQAGLYNFAGITKPTDYEKRVEAEAAETKDLLDKQWQQQLMKIQSDFQAQQAQMDRDFSIAVAQAKNQWDVQAAKDAHAQQSQENELDRESAMQRVTAQNQQQSAMTMDQIRQLIQSTYGGGG